MKSKQSRLRRPITALVVAMVVFYFAFFFGEVDVRRAMPLLRKGISKGDLIQELAANGIPYTVLFENTNQHCISVGNPSFFDLLRGKDRFTLYLHLDDRDSLTSAALEISRWNEDFDKIEIPLY